MDMEKQLPYDETYRGQALFAYEKTEVWLKLHGKFSDIASYPGAKKRVLEGIPLDINISETRCLPVCKKTRFLTPLPRIASLEPETVSSVASNMERLSTMQQDVVPHPGRLAAPPPPQQLSALHIPTLSPVAPPRKTFPLPDVARPGEIALPCPGRISAPPTPPQSSALRIPTLSPVAPPRKAFPLPDVARPNRVTLAKIETREELTFPHAQGNTNRMDFLKGKDAHTVADAAAQISSYKLELTMKFKFPVFSENPETYAWKTTSS